MEQFLMTTILTTVLLGAVIITTSLGMTFVLAYYQTLAKYKGLRWAMRKSRTVKTVGGGIILISGIMAMITIVISAIRNLL